MREFLFLARIVQCHAATLRQSFLSQPVQAGPNWQLEGNVPFPFNWSMLLSIVQGDGRTS